MIKYALIKHWFDYHGKHSSSAAGHLGGNVSSSGNSGEAQAGVFYPVQNGSVEIYELQDFIDELTTGEPADPIGPMDIMKFKVKENRKSRIFCFIRDFEEI